MSVQGDDGDFGTLDILRSIAICDHLNDSDHGKFVARMQLLKENQDLKTQSASKLAKNIEKFFEYSADSESECEDSAGLDHFTRIGLVAQIQYEMMLRIVSGEDDTDEDSDDDSSQGDDINENLQVPLIL